MVYDTKKYILTHLCQIFSFYVEFSLKNNAMNKVLLMTKITHYKKLMFTIHLSSKYNFLESVNYKYYINRS